MILNNIGRWEIEGVELASGDGIDALIKDRWVEGRVEYIHGRGYVFVAPGISKDMQTSLTARLPQTSRHRFSPS